MTNEQPVPEISANKTNSEPMASENKTATRLKDRLYRSENDRILAGVAGGLGEYFNLDPTLFRLGFVLVTLAGGSGILLYLIMWLIIPTESQLKAQGREIMEENAQEVQKRATEVTNEIRKTVKSSDARLWWSIILIMLGFMFLFQNFGFLNLVRLSRFWPLILIVLGIAIFIKNDGARN